MFGSPRRTRVRFADADATVEAMCRTRYRNLPLRSPRDVYALASFRRLPPPLGPNLDARRRRYRPEAVFVSPRRGRVRGNPLALAKWNPDAYAYPTPFALSPAFTPMRSVFETSWDRTAPCIFFRRMTVRRETVSRLSTHNGASLLRPSLLRPHFCAPSLLRPHFCAPHFCATHFSTPRAVLVDVSRRPDEVSFAVPPSRRDVRARAYLGSRRRLLDGAKPFGQSTNLHLHALARFANGGEDHSCGVVDWRDPSGAFEAREEPRPAFFLARRGSHRRAVMG